MFEAHALLEDFVEVLVCMSRGERCIEPKRRASRSDFRRDFDHYQTHPAGRVKTLLNRGQIARKAANNRVTT